MGLFDKIIKEGTKAFQEVTSEENKEKATTFFNNLKEGIEDTAKAIASEENKEKASAFLQNIKESITEAKKQAEAEEAKKEEYYTPVEDGKTCREKILEVLASEFPQYTVKEDVSPTTIGGTGKFMNYSIAVYDGETPKLFMMLIDKTTTFHREYRWSREEAEKKGYTFLNFVKHYPNTIPYITDRLHQYL
ncbi:MAG: hypothetical protein IKR11_13745 [Solobacterium sp.]|nr:hypothetical protein [Solobacterium sp.]